MFESPNSYIVPTNIPIYVKRDFIRKNIIIQKLFVFCRLFQHNSFVLITVLWTVIRPHHYFTKPLYCLFLSHLSVGLFKTIFLGTQTVMLQNPTLRVCLQAITNPGGVDASATCRRVRELRLATLAAVTLFCDTTFVQIQSDTSWQLITRQLILTRVISDQDQLNNTENTFEMEKLLFLQRVNRQFVDCSKQTRDLGLPLY